jgi:RNA polymerase sigma factor (sigma-70 family)
MAVGGLSPARGLLEENPKHPWRREFEKSIFSRNLGSTIMEEDIGDIWRELFLSDLSVRQKEAIALLYADPKMDKFLRKLAYSFQQEHDENDLRQDLATKIICAGPELLVDVKNLRAWLNTAAVNICRNDYRHAQKVRQHGEKSVDESVQSKMRGGAVVLQLSTVKTPEQQMQVSEQEAQLKDMLHGFFDSLPCDMKVVAAMWDKGKSPAEIAQALKKSEKTVYRHHNAFQKALVKWCMAEGVAPDEKRIREVIDDLSRFALAA